MASLIANNKVLEFKNIVLLTTVSCARTEQASTVPDLY